MHNQLECEKNKIGRGKETFLTLFARMCCEALDRLRAGLHAAKRTEHGQDAVEMDMCPPKSSVRIHGGHGGKRGEKKGFKEYSS